MQGLVHFYYGDRLKAFEIGLGTIIRSEGHSIATYIVAIDDNHDWINKIKNTSRFNLKIFSKTDYKDCTLDFFANLFAKENMLILIANIDYILESGNFQLAEFIQLIMKSEHRNEIVITSDRDIPEITNFANYVSLISSK